MINQKNIKNLLRCLNFKQEANIFIKKVNGYELKVDFSSSKIIYPSELIWHRETTLNFSQNENFVVFECIHSLLQAGYKPEQIELEKPMPGGHHDTGGYCDILVKNNKGQEYLLIECKTTADRNSEFTKAWKKMQQDGGQLFNYFNTYRQAQYICLYSSDFKDEQIIQEYYLVSMQDNDEFLQSDNNLVSFNEVRRENQGKEAYFNVWTHTYQQDAISHGLFESSPFKIGRLPFGVKDLKIVDEKTIQNKYHQFASILRQHNVSGRENAFDKLVNLFLAKIIDEKQNDKNLKVYWKGVAYDNYYDLQDRLQELYAEGMHKFLNEEITYIKDEKVEEAFKLFKNDPDSTKKSILEYFRQLKFYTNNDFAFLDVHNKPLFHKNAVILKEIVQMLQDIRLVNENEQNQFLGDLFEGFLDKGVKQNEGQFFTPTPIVRFLVSALPLEQINNQTEVPKVIDYACGAGHFLNEYAAQIKPIVEHKNVSIKEYYENIYGIEKEYRLSKVAKVSAFMYGQDDIKVIYGDALGVQPEIKNNSYSVLIANPPYSVKGFLATLSEAERKVFTLANFIDNNDTNNAIEVFFIERAKQLLKTNGVAGIILPSSILSNGNIYIKAREILLKYFDIIAIAEFGSGTFGKTGTNTVTLFLRRKIQEPNLAEHYHNRVQAWFDGKFHFDGIFEDSHLLTAYTEHCDYNTNQYRLFLEKDTLFEHENFTAYEKEFEKKEGKKLRQKLMAQNKRKNLKTLSQEQKEKIKTVLIDFIKNIEKEKLYYFMLAKSNPTPVLVITSPNDTKKGKKFLGYEWSTRKGDEGIKYLGGGSTHTEEALTAEQGINRIKTPLFNPKNPKDNSKLNYLIKQNFLGKLGEIPKHLSAFAKQVALEDMLDFNRSSFDKAIRTSVKKKIEIKSKYPIVRLKEITSSIESGKRPIGGVGQYNEGAYSLGGEHIGKSNGRIDLSVIKYVPIEFFQTAKKGIIQKNDILICKDGALTGKIAIVRDELDGIDAMINEHVFILRCKKLETQKYLFNYLYSDTGQVLLKSNITGAAQGGLNSTNLKNIKIPLPPLSVQKQIITECEKVDKEYENSRMKIEEYRAKIAQIFNNLEVIMGGVNH